MNEPLSPEEIGKIFRAIDNEPTRKLSELSKIAGLSLAEDYIGADLSEEDLSQDDLRNANFKDANLSKSNLSYSNLSGANLDGADLDGAIVKNTIFKDVQGISSTLREDLKRRGAIFPSDISKDRNLSTSQSEKTIQNFDFTGATFGGGFAARDYTGNIIYENQKITYGTEASTSNIQKNAVIESINVENNIQNYDPNMSNQDQIQNPISTSENDLIEVFFSYAHEDENLRNELAKHLSVLRRKGIITAWYDRDISAGTEWKNQINEHLETAKVILLLVSADFVASDYCYDIELKRAMERHEAKEARVIPIILRAVDWRDTPFRKLQALPKDALPVNSWDDRDEAFTDIARGIRRAVEELTGKKKY